MRALFSPSLAANRIVLLLGAALLVFPLCLRSQAPQKQKLHKPRQLDKDLTCHRSPATGELICTTGSSSESTASSQSSGSRIITHVRLVPVTCSVFDSGGSALNDLTA